MSEKLRTGEYIERDIPCLCGSKEELEIAIKDRYGIPLRSVICKKCGILRSNPYLDENSLNEFYSYEYDKIYRGHLDIGTHFNNRIQKGYEIIKALSPLIMDVKGKTVYEIGCSAGAILQAFKTEGAIVKGVDFGQKYLEYGRLKGLDLFEGSVEQLQKFPKADIIILCHVLEHIVDVMEFLETLKTIIKKETILYIEVPTIESIQTAYGNNIYNYLQSAHVWNFSNRSFINILEFAGYKVLLSGENEYCLVQLSNKKKSFNCEGSYIENVEKLLSYEATYNGQRTTKF